MFIRYLKQFLDLVLEIKSVYKSFFNLNSQIQPVFVSASDSTHEKSLLQFIDSVYLHEQTAILYIFDLGISKKTKGKLRELQKFMPNLRIRKFNFENFPKWINVKNSSKGEWAWKGIIVRLVRNELQEYNLNSDVILIWNDAGNKVISSMLKLYKYTKAYGFYSPSSDGTIEKWCHSSQIKIIGFPSKLKNKPMLNGALLSFNLDSQKANYLIDSWANGCLIKNVIAPKGTSRVNHRQDQSLITLFAYMNGLAPSKHALSLNRNSILIHQDIEKYL